MRDHSHIYDEHSDICTHCGQPLPMQGRPVLTYGRQGPNRPALAGTILLHLLLVLIWLFNPVKDAQQAKPASGDEGEVVYVAPMQQKPTEALREQAPPYLPCISLNLPRSPRASPCPRACASRRPPRAHLEYSCVADHLVHAVRRPATHYFAHSLVPRRPPRTRIYIYIYIYIYISRRPPCTSSSCGAR